MNVTYFQQYFNTAVYGNVKTNLLHAIFSADCSTTVTEVKRRKLHIILNLSLFKLCTTVALKNS